jgi:hypothetical protein
MMTKTYKWSHDEEITAEEFIKRLVPLVDGPVQMLWECDGDMFMSDYHKLTVAAAHLRIFKEQIDES